MKTFLSALLAFSSLLPGSRVLAVDEASAIVVDLSDQRKWIQVNYNKIPPNKVSFADDGLTIHVLKSASPLIYKLITPLSLKGFSVTAQFKKMDLETARHSMSHREDSPLRIGLVLEGERTLGFIQKKLAADWVVKLFALAKKGQGLSHIEFYNIAWSKEDLDFSRTHPKSDLLKENWVGVPNQNQNLDSIFKVQPTSKVLALWISVDGDDIGLDYETKIQQLKLFPRVLKP